MGYVYMLINSIGMTHLFQLRTRLNAIFFFFHLPERASGLAQISLGRFPTLSTTRLD